MLHNLWIAFYHRNVNQSIQSFPDPQTLNLNLNGAEITHTSLYLKLMPMTHHNVNSNPKKTRDQITSDSLSFN